MTATVEAAPPREPLSASSEGDDVAALRATGVVRRYRNGRGLGPVDLEVGRGETVALMGPNGCGKTTLLRLLATVARPQRGAIRWFGQPAAHGRRHLGLALDGALEDGGLTGRQATAFWCAQWVRGRSDVVQRTDRILGHLDLGGAADEKVASYSFGMRRRLALAAALVHDPLLVLLDEPTAGLDPDGANRLRALLDDRAAAGMTTAVASNDTAFVEAAAHRVVFLEAGLVLRTGSPAQLLAELPPGRVAELVVGGVPDLQRLRDVVGVTSVSLDGDVLTARFDDDRTVAQLVAAADAPGGCLRELRLRRPDLGDCFVSLTGHALEERR